MAAILPYMKNPLVFGPEATRAMSVAFDGVCRALGCVLHRGRREGSHRDKNHRVGAARRMRPRPGDHRGGQRQRFGTASALSPHCAYALRSSNCNEQFHTDAARPWA
jgi:hypothetical protein